MTNLNSNASAIAEAIKSDASSTYQEKMRQLSSSVSSAKSLLDEQITLLNTDVEKKKAPDDFERIIGGYYEQVKANRLLGKQPFQTRIPRAV